MNNIHVKDITVPLNEYASVFKDINLPDALQMFDRMPLQPQKASLKK